MKVKNRTLMFLIIYLAATTVSLSQLKVIPIMNDIAQNMGIAVNNVSWLMSVFTVAGIILAIPGAAILQKTGPKRLFMILMLALILGNLLGAFATNFTVLLISRMIEGIAFAMVIMNGVVLLGMWYPGNSMVVGIYTTFASVGNVIVMNAEMPVIAKFGSTSPWFIVAGLAAIFLILLGIFIKELAPEGSPSAQTGAPKVSIGEAFKSKSLLALAAAQLCVGFLLFTFMTIYPSIFTEQCGLDAATANFYAGLFGLFSIPFCIIGGAIIDKIGKASLVAMICFVGMAVASFLVSALVPGRTAVYVIHTLFMACFTGMALTAILSTAPMTMKNPALAGVAVAIVNMLYYVGIFIGTPITMGVAAKAGWTAAGAVLGVVSIIGVIITAIYMRAEKKASA